MLFHLCQGTPCNGGTSGVSKGNTCKICPDPTTQGIRSWVQVEVEIDGTSTSTTCGELDYGILLSVPTKSETCDATKLALSKQCCYNYPEDQCWICRRDMLYYNVRSELEVTTPDGRVATCGVIDKMLASEENRGQKCVTNRDALFDDCCYRQCSLCEGKGLKWWVEFDEPAGNGRRVEDIETGDKEASDVDSESESEVADEVTSCSSIDASLYTDFIEDNTEECTGIKSKYVSECCYNFPSNPCGLCKLGNTTQTLLWANEVELDGKNVSCGVIDNMVNSDEDSSLQCASAKEKYHDDCCFDKCSLCGPGKQLAWDYTIDYYEDTSKTCGEVEATFTADQVNANTKECSAVKSDFEDLCCFVMPTTPCEICSEFVRWEHTVDFDGEETTCKEIITLLKREEAIGEACLSAKEVSKLLFCFNFTSLKCFISPCCQHFSFF